ncbi:antitoxin VapB family protein [Salinarchaeum laminariae]|uniref:antitoxin VapB family protein n=1 Tax=Salinarchaeum laminariae TaxID=869888 RepID=UPI0020C0A00F|nr:antitoxin VapB family protein [Salinarchaeum laminariae]
MSNAEKRIPVTEERWKELHDLKGPGQTFDELIEELVEERKKERLFRDMNQIREESEFEPLDEV